MLCSCKSSFQMRIKSFKLLYGDKLEERKKETSLITNPLLTYLFEMLYRTLRSKD